MVYDKNTPVLFVIFNRPQTTLRVFEAIKKAQPNKLYIAADGPRTEAEKYLCEETRSVKNLVDWDCKVQTLFHNNNLGCRNAVSNAITWFFSNEEEGIVLEDDCLPDSSFFGFCSALLSHYRSDSRISHIGGVNFQRGIARGDGSYYFSRLTHIWGWAGWRRVWKNYDISIASFAEFEKQNIINKIPGHKPFADYWLNSFRNVYSGATDTWDYQYAYMNLVNGGLSIIPNKNLVTNIGVGINSTHTAAHPFQNLSLEKIDSIVHPPFIVADIEADIHSQRLEYGIEEVQKKKSSFNFLRKTKSTE